MFLLRLHHKKEAEHVNLLLENLGYMLGVYWQLDDLSKPAVPPKLKVKQDKVMLPLAVAIATSGMNPKAFSKTIDELKQKAYSMNKDVNMIGNANELSKDEYLRMFGNPLKKRK